MAKIFPFPYLGAKTALRKEILPLILEHEYDTFIEPLAGSAEISLQLMKYYKEKNIRKTFIINDINPYIIAFHYNMTVLPEALKKTLRRINKEEFNELRNRGGYSLDELFVLWTNSRFYYLNFNKKGFFANQFNNTYLVKHSRIDLCSELYNFHDVHFFNNDYRELPYEKYNNAFVYLDPPYENTAVKYGTQFSLRTCEDFLKNLTHNWLLSYNKEIGVGTKIKDLIKTNQYSANYKKGAKKTERRELMYIKTPLEKPNQEQPLLEQPL